MIKKSEQKDIKFDGSNNKIVGGDDNSQNTYISKKNGKLASLFERLKTSFENEEEIKRILNIIIYNIVLSIFFASLLITV